jgi:phage gpG-like protein
MGEPTFSYSIENDRLFKQAITNAVNVASDLRIPFKQISLDWYKSNRAIFKLKSKGLYPDLSEKYKKQKYNKYKFVYPILEATGRLKDSILEQDSPETINIIEKQQLTLGTQVPYGIYHQSDRERKKIPLRKFIFIGPEAPRFATSDQMGRPKRWLDIINNYLIKKIGTSAP